MPLADRQIRSPPPVGVLPLDEAGELGVQAVDLVQCRRVHLKTVTVLRIGRAGVIDLSERNECLSRGRVSDIRRKVAHGFADRGDGNTLGPSHFDVGFERKAEAAGARADSCRLHVSVLPRARRSAANLTGLLRGRI
nr:hypothetical protein [Mycobacterium heckeshornense]